MTVAFVDQFFTISEEKQIEFVNRESKEIYLRPFWDWDIPQSYKQTRRPAHASRDNPAWARPPASSSSPVSASGLTLPPPLQYHRSFSKEYKV